MIALITAALTALSQIPGLIQQLVAALQKNNQIQVVNLKAKALQDARAAMTDEEYKNASQEIHDLLSAL